MNESETLLLGELKGDVESQGEQLKTVVSFMASIDRRLRTLETFKSYVLGVIAAVTIGFNALVDWATKRHG